MLKKTKMIVGTGVAVVVLGGLGGGIALADSSSPAPPPTTTQPTPSQSTPAQNKPSHNKHRGLLGRIAHGEVTLNGKNHRVVDAQHGQVQSVSPTSITVKSTDGFTATYTVDPSTKVRKDKQASAIAQVANGDRVFVVATKSGTADTATRIADSGPPK
jgi:hypothetical protein